MRGSNFDWRSNTTAPTPWFREPSGEGSGGRIIVAHLIGYAILAAAFVALLAAGIALGGGT